MVQQISSTYTFPMLQKRSADISYVRCLSDVRCCAYKHAGNASNQFVATCDISPPPPIIPCPCIGESSHCESASASHRTECTCTC